MYFNGKIQSSLVNNIAIRSLFLLVLLQLHPDTGRSQSVASSAFFDNNLDDTSYTVTNRKASTQRKIFTGAVSTTVLGASFVALNTAWYKNYPRTTLRSFDDSKEWLQMDKAGHVWTSYNCANLSFKAWQWAGAKKSTSILLGSLTSLSYLGTIEYLDGRSQEWGWSWGDMAANIFGAGVFSLQQCLGNQQFVRIKFSAHIPSYSADLASRSKELFGTSLPSRLLKDYNSQTYWLSINMKSVIPSPTIPAWVNLAIGVGGQGMLGGFENIAYDNEGNISFDRRDIQRYRQWYLSFDIDLSKVKTNSKFLRSALDVFNIIKIPFPALEFSKQSFKGHWIYM
mgnify:CR=1 FL=1